MNDEETKTFKANVSGEIDLAVTENGGIEQLRKTYAMMPAIVDFLVGWVARGYARNHLWSHGGALDQEKLRRIYDLVRLRLETESSTS